MGNGPPCQTREIMQGVRRTVTKEFKQMRSISGFSRVMSGLSIGHSIKVTGCMVLEKVKLSFF